MNWMPEAIRDGIIVILVISGPLVLAAAFIGLMVGILQAATQVQEQTIGSALKIIGIFTLIIIAGFWMFQYLNQYTSRTISTAFTVVPHLSQKVIPRGVKEKRKNKPPENILEVEPPEKIESQIPESGHSPGVPYLGRPNPPKIPANITESLPAVPQMSVSMTESAVPGIHFQEPVGIPVMEMQSEEDFQFEEEAPDEEFPEINFVLPGERINPEEVNPQLTEMSQETAEGKAEKNISQDEEELPTWIEE